MLDPFGDFEVAGYLRNIGMQKDLGVIKATEHALFRAQLPTALTYLAQRRRIGYDDFLAVHRLLLVDNRTIRAWLVAHASQIRHVATSREGHSEGRSGSSGRACPKLLKPQLHTRNAVHAWPLTQAVSSQLTGSGCFVRLSNEAGVCR